MPLVAIMPALLYIQIRQFGGESLSAALTQIQDGNAQQVAAMHAHPS